VIVGDTLLVQHFLAAFHPDRERRRGLENKILSRVI